MRGFEAAGALEEGDRFFSEQTRHVAEADASEGSVAFLGLLEDHGLTLITQMPKPPIT